MFVGSFVRDLGRSFRLRQERKPSLLHWMGVMGLIAFSAFYLLRLTGRLPPRWDDLSFRLPCIFLCLGLMLRPWWLPRLARFYLPYAYFTVFYCLAFFLPLTLLENDAAPNTVANMMVGTVLLILVADWRNSFVLAIGGNLASALVFLARHPASAFPLEFLYWWVPLCMTLLAGAAIASYIERPAGAQRLRRPAPAQIPAAEPPAPRGGFAGRTVLVVDDSAFNRAIVRARLRELDLRVLEARDGEEALRIIDEGARPAAILMDMEMPGISGIEATRALRLGPSPANAIPVLALTANDLPSWREGALAVGMNGYLTKPVQPEVLSAELARVLALELPAPPAGAPVQTSSHSLRT